MQTETQTPLDPNTTAMPTPPVVEPGSLPPIPQKSPMKKYMLIAGGIVLLLLLLIAGIKKPTKPVMNQTNNQNQNSTPTITPTPPLANIATGSAYLNLKATVAELAATLNAYPLNDQTLNPPIIELNLGFSK